jgi:hypothetical protein
MRLKIKDWRGGEDISRLLQLGNGSYLEIIGVSL